MRLVKARLKLARAWRPGVRNQGAATEALRMLLTIAFQAGASHVAADVAPQNHASTRIVRKSGFTRWGEGFDADRDYVVRWVVAATAWSQT